MKMVSQLSQEAFGLLKMIVPIKSFSGSEHERALFLQNYLLEKGLSPKRFANNILVTGRNWKEGLPVLMLNSHIDTVSPSNGYSFDPYDPGADRDVVRGLGSNDSGASVATLITIFLYYSGLIKNVSPPSLPFNLLLLLSAEEETSGANGISMAIGECGSVDAVIVGEPTCMKAAVAERGLLVLDGVAKGVSGHAARDEGSNAIYKAIEDIETLRNFRFGKSSALMGDVKLTVTQINAGAQHNVVPDKCTFVVDIRPTDAYTNKEIFSMLCESVSSELHPRNLSNSSSATPKGHPFFKAIELSSIESFVSPTTSDWMRLNVPAIKMGPGDSARSHRPDEYVTLKELEYGIECYTKLIENLEL